MGTGFGIKTCAKSKPKAHGANLKIATRFGLGDFAVAFCLVLRKNKGIEPSPSKSRGVRAAF
ncbi:hypothetical protein MPL3356_180069 [Mesorhizobium plurifarium]|uniref:Uncharacterized protein n=1 Tax=Mesorhizobium plurifarium TaxID=69974 RepID=A0A090DMR6_MESPL|nr:hypothetical protein MPL3356_180069 [Mesorhizobium plurifarium]